MKRFIILILFLYSINCYCDSLIKISDISIDLLNRMNLSLNMNMYDIRLKNGLPDWKGNVQGFGVYIYDNVTIYFDESAGFYQNKIFIDNQNPKEAKVVMIEIGKFEDIIDLDVNKDSIIAAFGEPIEVNDYIKHDLFGSCTHYIYTDNEFEITISISGVMNQENYIYVKYLN